ncbi:MAG: hypothetical protein ACI94Y_000825 [Maribacter sp.]|jgi:hypothetical protein
MDYHLKILTTMAELNEAYKDHLLKIAEVINESEELAAFIDTEEPEDYKALQEKFEPAIEELYMAVANDEPLQIQALEEVLLNDDFGGLYLPKVLGFTILRGQLSEKYKYVKSQSHFRNILLFVCNSPNFDALKARIGQSIQVGFSLSSDIWITNILNEINNKRVKWWLQNQKMPDYRDMLNRKSAYVRYKRQFKAYNYLSTEFPTAAAELKINFGGVRDFLIHRIENNMNNVTLYHPVTTLLMNDALKGTPEHTYILGLFLNFFELNEDYVNVLKPILNEQRKNNPNFSEQYFDFVLDLHKRTSPPLNTEADHRFSALLDESHEDGILNFYNTINSVHSKGYMNDEVMTAVKRFHESNDGLSDNNSAVRQSILVYIRTLMNNLEVTDFATWFEMHKIFASYMNIFGNESFNQSIKMLYLKYIKRLLKQYTDKRGGDYQSMKKFTVLVFKEHSFMKDKDVKEIFKSKRKPKPKPTPTPEA